MALEKKARCRRAEKPWVRGLGSVIGPNAGASL